MYAVILAGGGGTRLWPLSRQARPKPFLPLLGERTMLQATVDRIAPLIAAEDVYLVADGRYADLVADQLPDVPEDHLIVEPVGRNTAAAVALAALAIGRPADDVMVVLPADHQVADEDGFRNALETAASAAADGTLVTLGIRPTGPETGYGYILTSEPIGDRRGALAVERFVEKPDEQRAREMVDGGRASWNAGIFVWRRDAVTTGLRRHSPDILEAIEDALAANALRATYPEVRSTSIDYALLEPASLEGGVKVVPTDVGWSDVGSWAALFEALSRTGEPVTLAWEESDAIDLGSVGLLVHAVGGRLVATVGLEDVVVVDTPDAVLVVARDRAQDVKKVVDRLSAEGRKRHL